MMHIKALVHTSTTTSVLAWALLVVLAVCNEPSRERAETHEEHKCIRRDRKPQLLSVVHLKASPSDYKINADVRPRHSKLLG
jgi:hypothetical protein